MMNETPYLNLKTETNRAFTMDLSTTRTQCDLPNRTQSDLPNRTQSDLSTRTQCTSCSAILAGQYIACAECSGIVVFCPPCFARGVETSTHRNWHGYRVVDQTSLSPFSPDWTADDETKLLDHLIEFGPDSLELASCKSSQGKRVGGNYGRSGMPLAVNDNLPLAAKPKLFKEKSPVEIKRHFEEFHLKNFEVSQQSVDQSFAENVPLVATGPFENPPRPSRMTGTIADLAHYNPARGDFGEEYDNGAERLLSPVMQLHLHQEVRQDRLLQEFSLALADIYNRRLRRRARVHRIVREHGLISKRKQLRAASRYNEVNNLLWRKNIPSQQKSAQQLQASNLRVFSQLLTGLEMDYLMEGLLLQASLTSRIVGLQNLRSDGIKCRESAKLKESLLATREYQAQELAAQDILRPPTLRHGGGRGGEIDVFGRGRRKGPTSLLIHGLPGYERLTENERELCSSVRLVPEVYLNIKSLLAKESAKICRDESGVAAIIGGEMIFEDRQDENQGLVVASKIGEGVFDIGGETKEIMPEETSHGAHNNLDNVGKTQHEDRLSQDWNDDSHNGGRINQDGGQCQGGGEPTQGGGGPSQRDDGPSQGGDGPSQGGDGPSHGGHGLHQGVDGLSQGGDGLSQGGDGLSQGDVGPSKVGGGPSQGGDGTSLGRDGPSKGRDRLSLVGGGLSQGGDGPNQSGDGLSLAEARALLSIDVNKTRKIYDFLVKHRVIKPKL